MVSMVYFLQLFRTLTSTLTLIRLQDKYGPVPQRSLNRGEKSVENSTDATLYVCEVEGVKKESESDITKRGTFAVELEGKLLQVA